MSEPMVREASTDDVPFLAETIISAEKSGTDRLGLAALCGLTEEQLRPLLIAMLQEEVDGCEYSVSSFLVAEDDGLPVAAVAGWIEGQPDDVPSMILKANLITFTFPPECVKSLQSHATSLADLQIHRDRGALQIEYAHVDAAYRGRGLVRELIAGHIRRAQAHEPLPPKAQLQMFSNNVVAKAAYEKLGFRTVRTFTCRDGALGRYLPHNERILLEIPFTK